VTCGDKIGNAISKALWNVRDYIESVLKNVQWTLDDGLLLFDDESFVNPARLKLLDAIKEYMKWDIRHRLISDLSDPCIQRFLKEGEHDS